MVEWSITVVLKTTVPRGTGGSNPSLSADNPCRSLIYRGFLFVLAKWSPISAIRSIYFLTITLPLA